MTASVRFIGVAVFAWAGVRAVSLGLVPGGDALAIDRPAAASTVPALEPTQLQPFDPAAQSTPAVPGDPSVAQAIPASAPAWAAPPPEPAARATGLPLRVYVPAALRYRRTERAYDEGAYAPAPYWSQRERLARAEAELPPPRALPVTMAMAPARPPVVLPAAVQVGGAPVDLLAAPLARHSKRLELSSWALLRGKPGDLLGPNSLATSGATLGGSQAGARLSYWITPHLAASLRSSTPLGGARGGEVAAGVRYRPFLTIPFAITAERRQRFGRAGGRNDFALFVEGGLWDRRMPAGFRLDANVQGGVVGIRHRALFGDGALTLTRPLWRNISGGFGVWGGAQPHLYRLDAGPRLTIKMTRSVRVHLDYRQRLLGTASPSSGAAVTIAGDF